MKDVCYLIADAHGIVRMTKRAPSLSRNEIGVMVAVTIPKTAFKAPYLLAVLDVPEESVMQPVIEMVVVDPKPAA